MITINGRFTTQSTTGVQRFAREVLSASAAMRAPWLIKAELAVPFVDRAQASAFGESIGVPVQEYGRWKGHAWEQFDLPRLRRDNALVNLCNTAPIFKGRQLVVLHDAAVASSPRNYSFRFRAWYQSMIRMYGRNAKCIASVSEFSAGEISRYFGVRRERIHVIPESGEHVLRTDSDISILSRLGLEADRYFLAVSSMAPNKNFRMVVEAVARMPKLPFKFLIVGGRNALVFAEGSALPSSAIEAGYVSDAELRALYEHAACFVYPSLYEGFGLPPLEAMTCGCPVIVSNVASLPEVCGSAAVYVDPRDPESIAQALARVLGSSSLRSDLRERGIAHASRWTWRAAAARLQEIVEDLERA